jgi:hypothetical protein
MVYKSMAEQRRVEWPTRSHRSDLETARKNVLEAARVWRDGLLNPGKYKPNTDDIREFGIAVAYDALARLEQK